MYKLISFILIFALYSPLSANESEENLKVVITGKVAKYIGWEKENSKEFIITVLGMLDTKYFDEIYRDKFIKNRPIVIKYIDEISQLTSTDILYLSKDSTCDIYDVLDRCKNRNILTVSDKRGFAQKGGMIQIYFVSQKLKLKINMNRVLKENLSIEPTLLRIADIVRDNL